MVYSQTSSTTRISDALASLLSQRDCIRSAIIEAEKEGDQGVEKLAKLRQEADDLNFEIARLQQLATCEDSAPAASAGSPSNSLYNILSCRHCAQPPVHPVEAPCCGGLYCWECAVTLCINQPAHCSCGVVVALDTFRPASSNVQSILATFPVVCRFEGCGGMFSGSTVAAHERTCSFRTVRCANSPLCGDIRDKTHHEQDECPYRQTACQACGQRQRACTLGEHWSKTCPRVTVQCPHRGCNVQVPRFQLAQHLNVCAYADVPCPFAEHGCTARMARCELAAHEKEAVCEHVELLRKSAQTPGCKPTNEALREAVVVLAVLCVVPPLLPLLVFVVWCRWSRAWVPLVNCKRPWLKRVCLVLYWCLGLFVVAQVHALSHRCGW